MNEFIPNARIRQIMVAHKVGQAMRPEYIPPEAQDGKSLVPHSTELTGFQRDLDPYIERTLQKFPNGADSQEIAAYLTAEAMKQGPTSAGPYLRATLLELRDALAPDYFQTIAQNSLKPMSASSALAVMHAKYSEGTAEREVLDRATQNLSPAATVRDLIQRLDSVADDYDREQQDWMAETADMLWKEADGMQRADTEARLKTRVEQLKAAETAVNPAAMTGAPVYQMS